MAIYYCILIKEGRKEGRKGVRELLVVIDCERPSSVLGVSIFNKIVAWGDESPNECSLPLFEFDDSHPINCSHLKCDTQFLPGKCSTPSYYY